MRTLTALLKELLPPSSGVWSLFVLTSCLYDHLVDSPLCPNKLSHKILGARVNLWYIIH